MNERDELDALAGAWSSIEDEAALSVPVALRRRRRQRAVLVLEMLGCGLFLAFALYFWLAGDGLVFNMAAGLFLAVAVLSGVIATKTRAGLGRWADWTTEGVLAFRLRECEVALLNAKYALGGAAVPSAFAVFVWLAAELGWDALPPGFHYIYAATVAVSVLVVGVWGVWRIRTKRREHERLRALLEALRDG